MDLIMNDLAEELILTAELLFGPMVKEWTAASPPTHQTWNKGKLVDRRTASPA
jgi:hypothetical protein